MLVTSTVQLGRVLGYELKITVEKIDEPAQLAKIPAACRQQLDVLARIDFDASQQQRT